MSLNTAWIPPQIMMLSFTRIITFVITACQTLL